MVDQNNEPMNPCPEWIHRFIILIYHDPSDLGSLILIWITPKEHTLSLALWTPQLFLSTVRIQTAVKY